jgi:hypothetical protein
MPDRRTDEYDRPIFGDGEVPPPDTRLGLWRGRITHPGAVTTPAPAEHARICVSGWIASGEWWLHCGRCRPGGPTAASATPKAQS